MTRLIIENGFVLCLDDKNTYHRHGTVVVENDRIAAVLPAGAGIDIGPNDRRIDATGKIVMPGLVDLHYHTAIGKGFNDHLPLWEYLDQCWYPLVRALDHDAAYWAAMASYVDSIRSGTTTVNDMYRKLDALADAADEIGIRAVLCNDTALAEHDLDSLEDNRNAYHRNHGRANGRIGVRVGIEWLPLSSPDFLRDARRLADELETGVHMHLNESLSEVEYCQTHFGRRPTELAYDTGLLGPDTIAAHCVHLDDREIDLMARSGTHISYNGSSNAKLGNGVARVPDMLRAGINVGLGHDATECNNSADMFEVMKFASLIQRAVHRDASLLPAQDVLKMATSAGSRALGHETGSIVAGRKADLILIETRNTTFTPLVTDSAAHLMSHLVFASNGGVVDTTIIDGRIVMQNRVLTTLNEEAVLKQANDAFHRLRAKIAITERPR